MYKNLLFITLLLLSTFSLCYADISSVIVSGRPGQTIGAGVVGKQMFQIQSGAEFSSNQETNTEVKSTILNNVIRYGLTDDFEVSSLINLKQDNTEISGTRSLEENGVSDFHLGFRSRVIPKQSGIIPALAIQTRFKLKTVSPLYKNKDIAPIIIVSAVHNLNQKYSLTTNIGYANNGNNSATTKSWATNLGYTLDEKVSLFIEPYGNFIANTKNIYINGGFDYLVNNDLKLDLSLGGGTNDSIKSKFISFGLSWRTSLVRSPL